MRVDAMQALGWTLLFKEKTSTKDLVRWLWQPIKRQAAVEGPPQELLSEAPKSQVAFEPEHRRCYLLRLDQIQTLYWISDELDRCETHLHVPGPCRGEFAIAAAHGGIVVCLCMMQRSPE